MNNNPYPIQIKKSLLVVVAQSLLGFIPGILIFIAVASGFFMWISSQNGQIITFWSMYGQIISTFLLPIIVLFVVGFFIRIGWLFLYLKSLDYSLDAKSLVFSGGVISRFEKSIPYSKIQHAVLYETFWQRIFGIASVSIETAREGGINYQPYRTNQNLPATIEPLIPDLKKEDAEKLKAYIISVSNKYKAVAGV